MQHSKANRLLSVKHNYFSLFRHSYMLRSLTTIIGQSIQYFKVR